MKDHSMNKYDLKEYYKEIPSSCTTLLRIQESFALFFRFESIQILAKSSKLTTEHNT